MNFKKHKDLKNDIELISNGICPRWGFIPHAGKKNVLDRGKWSVDINGNISFNNYYNIEKDRLIEKDWIIHLMKKSWFDFNEFMPIYMQACVNAGLKEITIRTNY